MEYQQTTQFDWNLFEHYNAHAAKRLSKLNNNYNNTNNSTIQMHLPDIYNMTILRQDGHTGGNDCVHYFDPGPIN